MRAVSLTSIAGGINRMRIKGNAAPNSLYDLVNAYVTQEGTVVPREGTFRTATLDDTTIGLVAFGGIFNVFSTAVEEVPTGYACNVLINPANTADTLATIWYAQPFMGFLYVVAEFASGDVVHYWLQSSGPWAADTVYQANQIVTPDSPNGLAYQATRTSLVNPTWAPSTSVTEGQQVEPSTPNGFFYTATYVAGTNPTTGTTEPVWPTTIGGTVDDFGDYQVNQLTATASSAAGLSDNITNIYGDTNITAAGATSTTGPTIGGVKYIATSGEAVAPAGTSSTQPVGQVTTWQGGTLYLPGALVIPASNQGAVTGAIPNGDFSGGSTDWTLSGNWAVGAVGVPFAPDTEQAYNSPATVSNGKVTMATPVAVTPGTSITAYAMATLGTNSVSKFDMVIELLWYDASSIEISASTSGSCPATGDNFTQISITGVAPAGAAYVAVQIRANSGTTDRDTAAVGPIWWNYVQPSPATNLIYKNVQTTAGTSGATQPTWPDAEGDEVTDGGVIWEAVGASIITWTATPIQLSGADEPTFPTTVGLTVGDGTGASSFAWTAIARNITDVNCPNTIGVIAGAAKIFAINGNNVAFSATTNPTDWTSANDAGFLPTGLQQYGGNAAAVLGLYRGNLMVFNGGGYQMWQIDPDPANMALLDAEPVGSTFTRGVQSVANDELVLTAVGVRNIGISGASGNLQAGTTGQPVDALIQAEFNASDPYTPISLYYPARGQSWWIFGPTAYVLTVNGSNQRSWSRYVFPDSITDWTLDAGVLYMRTAGNAVWQFSTQALQDDVYEYYPQSEFIVNIDAGTDNSIDYAAGFVASVSQYGAPMGSVVSGDEITGVGSVVATVFYSQYNSGSHPTYFMLQIDPDFGVTLTQETITSVSFVGEDFTWDFLTSAASVFSATGEGGGYWIWTASATSTHLDFVSSTDYAITITLPVTPVAEATPFSGVIWWPWLDMGSLGTTKEVIGFDLVGTGEVNVAIGYDQSNLASFTPNFLLEAADTVYGQPTPLPVSGPSFSLYLEFSPNQSWSWEAANLYVNDTRSTG